MTASASAITVLVLVISGYLFNLIFYPIRYFSARADGQKLFFMAAGTGLTIGAFVFLVAAFLNGNTALTYAANQIDSAIPIPYACKLVSTIIFAIGLGLILNGLSILVLRGICNKETDKQIYKWLIQLFGSPRAQLLRRAADDQRLVLITLKSRKVYCGRILRVPVDIESDSSCIEVLPIFSTYRDKDTLAFGRKTNYPAIDVWELNQYIYTLTAFREKFCEDRPKISGDSGFDEKLASLNEKIAEATGAIEEIAKKVDPNSIDIEDWAKVVPIKEIETLSFYDAEAYDAWFDSGAKMPASINMRY